MRFSHIFFMPTVIPIGTVILLSCAPVVAVMMSNENRFIENSNRIECRREVSPKKKNNLIESIY